MLLTSLLRGWWNAKKSAFTPCWIGQPHCAISAQRSRQRFWSGGSNTRLPRTAVEKECRWLRKGKEHNLIELEEDHKPSRNAQRVSRKVGLRNYFAQQRDDNDREEKGTRARQDRLRQIKSTLVATLPQMIVANVKWESARSASSLAASLFPPAASQRASPPSPCSRSRPVRASRIAIEMRPLQNSGACANANALTLGI